MDALGPTEAGFSADAVCEGGDLDCGSGLLLIIREALEPLGPARVLEIRSSETSVREDLPAWCRMVGHELLGATPGAGRSTSYFVRKGGADALLARDLQAARDFRWRARAKATESGATRVFARNHAFDVGQPASFDTADAAPSAVEFLLGAIAGELIAGLRWRASRAGIPCQALELSLSTGASDPGALLGLAGAGRAGLSEIAGRLYVQCDAGEEVLAPLWRETLERSLIVNSLGPDILLELDFKVIP